MRSGLRTFTMCALVLTVGSTARAQIAVGVRIGVPPPPRVYVVAPQPGPDFAFVEGYWYPAGGHYAWHNGYWTRPPYAGAYWVAPYHVGGRYYAGRWEGRHGNVMHDHRWDHDRDRDRREGRRDERHDDRREDHSEHRH
jgi:hypothetical protein